MSLLLVSHPLCPYVQRAAIALREKNVAFERRMIDLAHKPDWFLELSPLGKTPVLVVDGSAIFESAVILEYLEETQPHPLHPRDPLARARHRAWIEFASAILNDIAGFYGAADEEAFAAKIRALRSKFERVEAELDTGPYFAGERFSLPDAAFAPVLRYFDLFDEIEDFGILAGLPKIAAWRGALATTPSVRAAVDADYQSRLRVFCAGRKSLLAARLASLAA